MSDHYLENITWEMIKSQHWEAKDKTFEYLCGEFMQIYFDLPQTPMPSTNSSYPWIEGPPIEKDWSHYWFQSKYWEDAFSSWFYTSFERATTALEKWLYPLEIICLFSRKDHFFGKKETRDTFNSTLEEFCKRNKLEKYTFYWNLFLSELRNDQYSKILYKYFPIEDLQKEIFENKANQNDVNMIEVASIKDWICDSFIWDQGLYDNELRRAKILQQKYSIRKLCYVNTPWIIDLFEEIEDFIAGSTFEVLETYEFSDLQDYTETWARFTQTQKDPEINKRYWTEIDSLLQSREWVFINYLWEKKATLTYEKKEGGKKVSFSSI